MLTLMTLNIYGQEATFQILSITPEPGMFTFGDATGLSADGSVVVGVSDSDDGLQAFRWENGEILGLGFFPEGSLSYATAVSYDGAIVLGAADNPIDSEETYEGFRWDVETGQLEGIGYLPNSLGFGYSEPRAISADGSVIVGVSQSDNGFEAFRWENGEMIGLGDFEGGEFDSYTYSITADGSIIVGYGTTESGTVACKWEDGEMTDLGSLGGGDSYAHNITPDGSIIVGQSNNQAFRWENNIMEGLETLPEWVKTSANGISADGTIIVGFGYNAGGDMIPLIWTENAGVRKIQEVLEVDYGLDLGVYTLQNASKVTHDGTTITIIGRAFGLDNLTTLAWRATIPYSFVTLSSQELLSTQVKIYPNPATNLLFVEADSPIKLIEIFDLQGRKINEFMPNAPKAEIQINNLTNGNYLVKVHSQSNTITKQIIKK